MRKRIQQEMMELAEAKTGSPKTFKSFASSSMQISTTGISPLSFKQARCPTNNLKALEVLLLGK